MLERGGVGKEAQGKRGWGRSILGWRRVVHEIKAEKREKKGGEEDSSGTPGASRAGSKVLHPLLHRRGGGRRNCEGRGAPRGLSGYHRGETWFRAETEGLYANRGDGCTRTKMSMGGSGLSNWKRGAEGVSAISRGEKDGVKEMPSRMREVDRNRRIVGGDLMSRTYKYWQTTPLSLGTGERKGRRNKT